MIFAFAAIETTTDPSRGQFPGVSGVRRVAARASSTLVSLSCALLLLVLAPIAAQASDCNKSTHDPITHVRLPGLPFTALPSADGCWIFVSLSSATSSAGSAVAVLSRHNGVIALEQIVHLRGEPAGMVLTHDGKLLIIPNGMGVAFLDVHRLETGEANAVLGYWDNDHVTPGHIYASVTSDDRYLFVSNEAAGTISVIDVAAARRSRFLRDPLIGTIPIGSGAVGLALSTDERFLFATVQEIMGFGWPKRCRPEADPHAAPDHAEGAVVVIDIKLAISDPRSSVLKWVGAGCNPVRVVTAAEKGEIYVTARGSHTLLVFTQTQLTHPGYDTQPAQIPVGAAPVGVAVIEEGRKIVVTNSDRFADGSSNTPSLFVVDSSGVASGSARIVGVLPAKGFPREIRTTADGSTMLVTNFSAGTLEIIDLTRTPWVFSQIDASRTESADIRPGPSSRGPLVAGNILPGSARPLTQLGVPGCLNACL